MYSGKIAVPPGGGGLSYLATTKIIVKKQKFLLFRQHILHALFRRLFFNFALDCTTLDRVYY
jgi:hypothetical protein